MPVASGPMRFSYDDAADAEQAFHRRRDELGEAFAEWLHTHGVAGDPNDAGLLMDWKFGYADGELDTWTVSDVSGFLLDWCPRKLSAAPQDCAEIPLSVAAFVEFLAHEGLLGQGSQAPAQIRMYCEKTGPRFVREMGNPANFGMAKSLFSGVGGLEPGAEYSPASLRELMARVPGLGPDAIGRAVELSNDENPYDEDDVELAVIGPVRWPGRAERLAAIRDAPHVRRLGLLAQWCPAPGHPLTAKGNLRLADARHLVELLGRRRPGAGRASGADLGR